MQARHADPVYVLKRMRKKAAIGFAAWTVLFASVGLPAQQAAPRNVSAAAVEFPLIMRQNVKAGATAAGTRVQAKLTLATLFEGAVIPEGAVFSGVVVESAAKTKTSPSRLSLRMDSAQWKNGSAPLKIYLSAWYYPIELPKPSELSDDPFSPSLGPQRRTGAGSFPDPTPPAPPILRGDADASGSPRPTSTAPQHPVLMKDVKSAAGAAGAVTLTCERSNLQLDRSTTYVFATGQSATLK